MNTPETISAQLDNAYCKRCGHPAWAHGIGEICDECDNGEATTACGLFSLYGFIDVVAQPVAERTLIH